MGRAVIAVPLVAVALWVGPAGIVQARASGVPHVAEFAQTVPARWLSGGDPAASAAHAGGAAAARALRMRGGPGSAAASGGWRTTPVLRAPRRFSLLGLLWRGGDARFELHVQRTGGGWSRWVVVPGGEGAPARGTGATRTAGPVWTGDAQRYELRASRPVRALRVRFVAVRGGTAAGAGAARGGRPAIVPRSRWDPGNVCRPRTTPRYGRVDLAIVHHTESLSAYSPAQSADMVLAICLFHRDGNGWNDIGYNLLVDRFGTVFEGRAGGVDQPVVGAHAQGWNDVSTGIAMIGSYSLAPPPPAALRALERVIAWKLGLAGVPATGSIAERSTGGVFNAHRAGAIVRFARVSGHRDGDSTECPGAALYALLPRVGNRAAALLPPPADLLTISPVGAPAPQGRPIPFTGRLARAGGSRPLGAPLALQQRDGGGAWQAIGAVTTGVDGIWRAAPRLTQDGTLRVIESATGIASPAVDVLVQTGVRARVASRHLRAGQPLRLTGATSPPKARVRVLVERRRPRGRAFARVRAMPVATTPDGRFDLSLALGAPGIYRVTVTTRADAANAAGTSRRVLVRVLRR